MLKKLLATLMALFAAAAFAAADANKADQATLESIKGVGPAISAKILEERKKAPFKDWPDLMERVKGVGGTTAAKFSSAGLTVNGSSFSGAAPAPKADKAVAAQGKAATAAAVASAAKK